MEQKSSKRISFKRREKIASSRSRRVAGSSTSRIRAKKKYLSFKTVHTHEEPRNRFRPAAAAGRLPEAGSSGGRGVERRRDLRMRRRRGEREKKKENEKGREEEDGGLSGLILGKLVLTKE
uniref:Uncharacterized protein n=1 Tax=Oryza meridionalis TaxID=40149 RepID=A0A0E0C3H5_9ORYZ